MTLTPDDVISNAFIESLRIDYKNKFIPYDALNAYNKQVEKCLFAQKELVYSKWWHDSIEQFLNRNKHLFFETTIDDTLGIQVKDEVTVAVLIDQFRSRLPHRLVKSFTDPKCVKALLKAIN